MPTFSCWHFALCPVPARKVFRFSAHPCNHYLDSKFWTFIAFSLEEWPFSFCCACRCSAHHLQFIVMSLLNDEHLDCRVPFLTTLCTPIHRPCSRSFWTPLASYHSQESATVTWKYKFGLTGWQAAVRANVPSLVVPTWTSHWQARQQHQALVLLSLFFFSNWMVSASCFHLLNRTYVVTEHTRSVSTALGTR